MEGVTNPSDIILIMGAITALIVAMTPLLKNIFDAHKEDEELEIKKGDSAYTRLSDVVVRLEKQVAEQKIQLEVCADLREALAIKKEELENEKIKCAKFSRIMISSLQSRAAEIEKQVLSERCPSCVAFHGRLIEIAKQFEGE